MRTILNKQFAPILLVVGCLLAFNRTAEGNPPPPPPGGYGVGGCFCAAGYASYSGSGGGSAPVWNWDGAWTVKCDYDASGNLLGCYYPYFDNTWFQVTPPEPGTYGYPMQIIGGGVMVMPGTLACVFNPDCTAIWYPQLQGIKAGDVSCILLSNGSFYGSFYLNIPPTKNGSLEFRGRLASGLPPGYAFSGWNFEPPLGNFYLPRIPPSQLGHWKFNGDLAGTIGQQSAAATPCVFEKNWNGKALVVDQNSAPVIAIPGSRSGGFIPNATRNSGTIRFWYRPSWSSGSMNFQTGNFLHTVSGGGVSLILRVTDFGSNIELVTSGASNFKRPISWVAGQWHQIVITYISNPDDNTAFNSDWIPFLPLNHNGTALYVDGQKVGVSGSSALLQPYSMDAFYFGDSNQPKGLYDELETFNYPLPAAEISQNYQAALVLDTDGDHLPNFEEVGMGTDPEDPDTDDDGCQDDVDDFPLVPEGCHHNPYDTTPPIIELILPAAATLIP